MKHLLYFVSICSLLLLADNYSMAQLLYVDDVQMTVRPGAQLTVKGTVEIDNTGLLFNNGTLDLSGDITNNTASQNPLGTGHSGTVVLNGGLQNINGTTGLNFRNLTLLGTGNKVLQNLTRVGTSLAGGQGVLSINDRVLDLNSNKLIVLNQNTTAITSTSGGILSEQTDNSSIVEWQMQAVTGPHVYPFINAAGDQIPVTFDQVSGNTSKVNIATYPTASNNTPFPILPVLVDHVRDLNGVNNAASTVDRFWYINATGMVSGSTNADITFTYGPGEAAAAGNLNMRAQKWQSISNGWEAASPGQTNPTTQSVRVPNVTVFNGPWALARDISPLPVELLSFTAKPINNEFVRCEWLTASEINSDYFLIQRSQDVLNFETIGSLNAAGFSNTIIKYDFDDVDPYDGVSYYRLQQFDFDGSFEYSEIVAVNFKKEGGFQIYPNVTHDIVNIVFEEEIPNEVYITNALGQLLKTIRPTTNNEQVALNSLNPGVYFVSFILNNKRVSQRVVRVN